jgi:hypothetical protein
MREGVLRSNHFPAIASENGLEPGEDDLCEVWFRSNPEILLASKCFLLFIQKRTSLNTVTVSYRPKLVTAGIGKAAYRGGA